MGCGASSQKADPQPAQPQSASQPPQQGDKVPVAAPRHSVSSPPRGSVTRNSKYQPDQEELGRSPSHSSINTGHIPMQYLPMSGASDKLSASLKSGSASFCLGDRDSMRSTPSEVSARRAAIIERFMERRKSGGKIVEEPGRIAVALKMKALVIRARLSNGITGDPDQFTEGIEPHKVSPEDEAKVARWVDIVRSLPPEKMVDPNVAQLPDPQAPKDEYDLMLLDEVVAEGAPTTTDQKDVDDLVYDLC